MRSAERLAAALGVRRSTIDRIVAKTTGPAVGGHHREERPAHYEEANDFPPVTQGRFCALRSECCGGKFQVGGGLVDTLGDGVTGGRVEVGTTRERFSSGRGDEIWDAGAPTPGGRRAAVVNAMTGRAAGEVVVPGDLVVRQTGDAGSRADRLTKP